MKRLLILVFCLASCGAFAQGYSPLIFSVPHSWTGLQTFNSSIAVKNGATSAGFVRFYEDSDNGTNYIDFFGPAALGGNYNLTCPTLVAHDTVAVLGLAQTWTAAKSSDVGTLGTIATTYATTPMGLALINDTASTAGAKMQDSPALYFEGHAWDDTPGEDNILNWRQYMIATEGGTPVSSLVFQSSAKSSVFATRFTFASSGDFTPTGNVYLGSGQAVSSAALGVTLNLQSRNMNAAGGGTAVAMASGSNTASSGGSVGVSVNPTVNQTGTAAMTDFKINRTETATGSGAQYFIEAGTTTSPVWSLTNKGIVTTGVVADAALQYGSILMADAGTDKRFDINTAGGTLAIGVLAGTGMSAQGTMQGVVFNGLGRVLMAEDIAVARGEVVFQSAGTAGRADRNAALQAAGLNIGKSLTSENVTATIVFNGCTGGTGCINTALNTPNVGPAGQITLNVDVAALGWAVGEPVVYYNSGGTTPTGLTDGNTYWLLSVSTTNVTISTSRGGSVLVPTSQGDDATQYLQRLPFCVVSIQ